MRIAFTSEEMIRYGTLGLSRCAYALEDRRQGAHGFDRHDERWQIDVEGVLTEAAAAKALGLPYEPVVGELDTLWGDIAAGIQVRGTKYPKGSLLVHDKDPDDHAYVLVTGKYGVYDIRGWIFAREGKVKELWKEHKNRGAYWVPQDRLRPMESLVVPEPS
jgi:hypothetical protein